jgi:hypothetical protein
MSKSKSTYYFETSGFSMWPFLRQKDRIIIEETDCSSLNPGDMILYTEQGQPACHRLVRKKRFADGFTLFVRGDYLPSWKTVPVVQAQLAGRVRAIVRGKRIIPVKGFLSAALGRCIVIFSPLAILIFVSVRKLVKR